MAWLGAYQSTLPPFSTTCRCAHSLQGAAHSLCLMALPRSTTTCEQRTVRTHCCTKSSKGESPPQAALMHQAVGLQVHEWRASRGLAWQQGSSYGQASISCRPGGKAFAAMHAFNSKPCTYGHVKVAWHLSGMLFVHALLCAVCPP